ncbi:MAG: cell wall-binding repeat-containing protein [Peptostreptococcus porci]|nr:cell wall-binding repeat-containing protein [Peptostreptococcus porci]
MKSIKKFISVLLVAIMFISIVPTINVKAEGNYNGTITRVGQWTGESTVIKNDTINVSSGSDKLGTPIPNYGLLRGLAKTFLGWSDKEPVGNGEIAEGARLFSPEDTVSKAFPNGIDADSKIYAVYFSLNDPKSPLPTSNIQLGLALLNGVDNIKIDGKKIDIDRNTSNEDILPYTKNVSSERSDNTISIVDHYKAADDSNSVHEIVLKSEFEMADNIHMVTYKNPGGYKPVLSYNYSDLRNTEFSKKQREDMSPQEQYTFVDLTVELDQQMNIPEILYMDFKSYPWRPLYMLDEQGNSLNIISPVDGNDLGNGIDAFSTLISNTNPSTTFGFKTTGKKKFTIRTILRDGVNERIPENKVVPTGDNTIAEEIIENMTLKFLSSDEIMTLTGKSKEESYKSVVTIKDSVAKSIADITGSQKLKAVGSVKGLAVANAGRVSFLELRSANDINTPSTGTLNIGYTINPVVTFVKNYGDENASDYKISEVEAEKDQSINGDSLVNQNMPSNPTRSGYRFVGWSTNKDANSSNIANTKFDGDTVVSDNVTVYAIWEKNSNGGGGSNNPTPNPDKDKDRVSGNDRIETAVKISEKYFGKSKTVIVVRSDLFPDSMTATVLSKQLNAPILLTDTNILDQKVKDEIKRLGAEEVIIVGGPHSVSEKVRNELKELDSDKYVERISGEDRYGTSEMVARRVVGLTGKLNKAVVASGEVFPDALSVSSFAAQNGYPILLVTKENIPSRIKHSISDLDIRYTYVVGGVDTISQKNVTNLPGVLERMGGVDRYQTSVEIAKSKFKTSDTAFLASGEVFSDALVIGPVAGKYASPILLTPSKNASKFVVDYVTNSKIKRMTIVGGQRYIPDSVVNQIIK